MNIADQTRGDEPTPSLRQSQDGSFLLIFLVVCPLMMFFMMRGMHGGQANHDAHTSHNENGPADYDVQRYSKANKLKKLDGSHESIDNP